MKAKYQHYGNECIIYDQIICEDNLVITIQSYNSCWFDTEPKTETKVCITNAEARRLFYKLCDQLEKQHCECIYKED